MAQTYTLTATEVAFALNKCLLGVFNGSGSGRVVRVYRIWTLNNGIALVTGVLTNLELRRITAGSGGTTVTPAKHDTGSEAFPGQIVVSTNMIYTASDLFRRAIWSNDEAIGTTTVVSIDEMEVFVPLNLMWDVGYADATVEPIVCREGYGAALINTGNTAVGVVDVFMEVTLANS